MTQSPGEHGEQPQQQPWYPPPPPPAGSGQPPYPYYPAPYGYYPPRKTNGMAVAALVCGIVGVLGCFVTSPLAVIFGHIGLHQVKRRGEEGSALALVGLILGYVGLALIVLMVAVFAFSFSGIDWDSGDQGI